MPFTLLGCTKGHINSVLSISNESGEDLWVESNIVSAEGNEPKDIWMPQGVPYQHEVLARSENYNSPIDLSLDSCIYNEDACVCVYKKGDKGERVLGQKWRHSERNDEDRNLFNESNLDRKATI